MKAYSKFLVHFFATVVAGLVPALADGHITSSEWINVAILGVGSASVLTAANVPYAKYTKVILSVLTAVLVALASAISSGISTTEWLQIVVAGLGAAGVYQLSNGSTDAQG